MSTRVTAFWRPLHSLANKTTDIIPELQFGLVIPTGRESKLRPQATQRNTAQNTRCRIFKYVSWAWVYRGRGGEAGWKFVMPVNIKRTKVALPIGQPVSAVSVGITQVADSGGNTAMAVLTAQTASLHQHQLSLRKHYRVTLTGITLDIQSVPRSKYTPSQL